MASAVEDVAGRAVPRGATPTVIAARFYPPAATLADLVIDYAIYDSGPPGGQPRSNVYAPGPANICLTFGAGPLRARIRNWQHDWTDGAVLFGPTSKTITVDSDGGRLIGLGVTPLGWSRLTPRAATRFANRVVALAEVVGSARERHLYAALAAAPDDAAIVGTLDAHLSVWLGQRNDDDATIRHLTALLLDPAIDEVAMIAARLELPQRQIRRIAGHYFGFPPKVVIRRIRFMRALMALADHDPHPTDFAAMAPGYHDRSHFIRDAQLFLDTTGRRFLRDITPLMETMRVGRRARFGQPLQGLIVPGHDNRSASLDDTPPPA